MQPHEIKCAVVSRMWQDGVTVNRRWADIETVASLAVPPSAFRDAVDEIEGWMLDDADCPVVKTGPGMIALEPDEGKIRDYLERYCGSNEDWPPALRDL